jgi:hypothetical protein
MIEPHVITALHAKRAEIGGEIKALERRLAGRRAELMNVDATIRLFAPGSDPEAIPPKRRYRRTMYFAHSELARLTLDALRLATGPLSAPEIAAAAMRAKEMPTDDPSLKRMITFRVASILCGYLARGTVARTGPVRDARWAIAPALL